MILEKKYLELFFKSLKGTEGMLTLAEGRIRDSFFKTLLETTKQFEDERAVIYEKFCKKDESGKPDTSDGKYHFEQKDLPEIQKELHLLLSEEVELKTPQGLKEIMERTSYKPNIGEAESIDIIISKL